MNSRRLLRRVAALVALACVLGGCVAPAAAPKLPLFERLGGMPVLTALVDETLSLVATDPRTRRSFEGVKLSTLKQSIVQHLCQVTGGPCRYEGDTMAKAHRDLRITDAEFDLMVTAMRASLDRHVGVAEKNELLRLLAPMKRDVVTG